MNAWSGLFKKEFRLGLPSIYLSLALITIWFAFGIFLQWKLNGPIVLFGFSIIAIVWHVFYLPIYLMTSINRERGRMHLWLHSPHSGNVLLLAKMINGIVAMLLSLTVTIGISFFVYRSAYPAIQEVIGTQINDLLTLGALFTAQIALASLYFTIWGIFLWVVNLVLKSFVGKFNWVVLIVLIIAGLFLLTKWESSSLFMMLTQWGKISIDVFVGGSIEISDGEFFLQATEMDQMYIGNVVYYSLVGIAVFITSGWLFGRKVEV